MKARAREEQAENAVRRQQRRHSPKGVDDFDDEKEKELKTTTPTNLPDAAPRSQRFAAMGGNLTDCVAMAVLYPLLPELFGASESGGASSYGYVQSISNLFGLVGGLYLAKYSDRRGRRLPLLICSAMGLAGTILLGLSWISFYVAVVGLLLKSLSSTSNKTLCKAVIVWIIQRSR